MKTYKNIPLIPVGLTFQDVPKLGDFSTTDTVYIVNLISMN